jgi:hypothetical protein
MVLALTAKEIFSANIPVTIAVLGLATYFTVIAFLYVFFPRKYAPMFSIAPVGQAGVTEIRVYYGGISFALGFFLVFLFASGLGEYALIGGLTFSTTVLTIRVLGTVVDKGWKETYTKLAIPVESLFVILLWLMFILSKVLY